jgi:hypothetical protein
MRGTSWNLLEARNLKVELQTVFFYELVPGPLWDFLPLRQN